MLPAMSVRYLLDSISARLDESRDISRYQIGLLIFLGLLGTFWGLLETIGSVSEVINGLSVGEGDLVTMFDELKAGLAAPMGGMGTAFGSSLFGLAGSLVLGFLDLQANQAQNSFYNEVEEWLSGLTRLSGARAAVQRLGDVSIPAYVQALLEQTAENLEGLQRSVARSEENQPTVHSGLIALTERLSRARRPDRDRAGAARAPDLEPGGAASGARPAWPRRTAAASTRRPATTSATWTSTSPACSTRPCRAAAR